MNSYEGAQPLKVLREVFGYSEFRLLQSETINNVLSRHDTLTVMPTGGGKSLCYQVPALIFGGMTVVVSPLIALMQDQVTSLRENGVSAAFLNSTISADEWRQTAGMVAKGEIKLLYVAPEALNTARMSALLHSDTVRVDCITVDEAHCVSEWGHDFRPDYMAIAPFREGFSQAVLLALTATATEAVRADIVRNLHMTGSNGEKAAVFVSSFNRENIFLEVQPKRNKSDAMRKAIECIKAHDEECGIIYCCARRTVDEVAAELARLGFSALAYHAGLDSEERTRRQDEFVRGRVHIMVATVAFGMGINVPNVRFVIHFDLPKSVEQYYQEVGRAGRDGLPSHALLLFGKGDIWKIRRFFDESADRKKAEELLQAMVGYAESTACRRKTLLRYFGEAAQASMGCELTLRTERGVRTVKCCDVCARQAAGKAASVAASGAYSAVSYRNAAAIVWKAEAKEAEGATTNDYVMRDVTIPVQKFLSCVVRTGSAYTAGYVIRVLLGSEDQRVVENGHNKLSTFGIGNELESWEWHILASKMLNEGLVRKVNADGALALTAKAVDALHRRERIRLPFNRGELKQFPIATIAGEQMMARHLGQAEDNAAVILFGTLKKWRRRIADEENVPPYVIFNDKTLTDIVLKRPRTIDEFRSVYGIGRVKAERFGDAVVRIVCEAQ